MNEIENEIKELIRQNAYLVITGFTSSNGISVNIAYLKDYIRSFIGIKNYKKYSNLIIEQVEKLRDKIYSKCRYNIKVRVPDMDHEKIDFLVNRTKRRSRTELGKWVCEIREWDTIGTLTLAHSCNSDAAAEDYVNILYNYLTDAKLISDFFYCIEYSSHHHINFFCRANPELKANDVRKRIRSFWQRNMGIQWIRKYDKRKESQSYWSKDINSDKRALSNGCWNIYYDLLQENKVAITHE